MPGKRGPISGLRHLDGPILQACKDLNIMDSRKESVLMVYRVVTQNQRNGKGLGQQPTYQQCCSDKVYVRIKNLINK